MTRKPTAKRQLDQLIADFEAMRRDLVADRRRPARPEQASAARARVDRLLARTVKRAGSEASAKSRAHF